MRLTAAFEGKLEEHLAREAGVAYTGTLEAVAGVTLQTKLDIRAVLNAAFTGSAVVGRNGNRRVANSVRGKLFEDDPDGAGRPAPVGIVFSRFGRRRGGRYLDYLLPHALGMTIEPTTARRLYIPLQPGMRGPLARRARASFKLDPTIEIIPASPGVWVVVRKRRGKNADGPGTAIGLLVNRVKLPRRVNLDGVQSKASAALPAKVIEEMQKADGQLRYENYKLSTRTDGKGGAGKRRGRRGQDI